MPNTLRRENLARLAEYPVLLARVRETFILGQQKAEELKVQTYWEAGRLIHLRHHQDETGYGYKLMARLADNLGVGRHLLYRMLHFYEAYPIVASWQQLSWSHLRTLARVPDRKKRPAVERQAVRENGNAERLEKHVRFLTDGQGGFAPPSSGANTTAPRRVQQLEPKHGTPGLYRLVADGDGLAGGPSASRRIKRLVGRARSDAPYLDALQPGELVTLSPSGHPKPAPDATAADLYTYVAEVLRLVDGDTLWLKIWLKPGHWLKEKGRLRGIDCPELSTPEGKAAKRFVETLVKEAASITITTTKPDKWDRYLSDLFVRREDGEELFLNNLLLENGHARRYDKVTPGDWEE